MRSFFLKSTLIAVFALILSMFLPWWSIAISAFVTPMMMKGKFFHNFFAGFLGIFGLWFLKAIWIMMITKSALPEMMGNIFSPAIGAWRIALITALVGGLVAAFTAAAGGEWRKLLRRD